MLITFKTNTGLIAASLTDISIRINNKTQSIELVYKNKNRGSLIGIIGTTDDDFLEYFAKNENRVEYIC